MQRQAVAVHRRLDPTYQQYQPSQRRAAPDARLYLFDLPQRFPRFAKETPAEAIGQVPEGNLGRPERGLALAGALVVEAAMDAKPQFDKQVQIARAGGHGRPLEFKDVPGGEAPPNPAEGRGRGRSAAQ